MFERISNGFALARSSWNVLLQDKHLLVFPFVSGFLFLIVVASFAVPLALLVDWNEWGNQAQNNRTPWWTYAVSFAFYFCTYFVTIFCNSALLSCTFLRFNGETPTVADGAQKAFGASTILPASPISKARLRSGRTASATSKLRSIEPPWAFLGALMSLATNAKPK